MTTIAPLPDLELKDLKSSLQRGSMQPRDQLVRLKAIVASNTVTCAQVAEIIDITRTIQVDVIVAMFPAISDPDNFEKVVLGALQWPDQREAVKEKLKL